MAKKNVEQNSSSTALSILENAYLKKGVGAIRITVVNGKRSLLQRKMTNAFFKVAVEQGLDNPTFETNWATINAFTNFDSNNIQYFKDAADDLTSLKVKFDVLGSDDIKSVGTANIFSAVTFRSNGKIYFEMPEITRRMVADPNRFAHIHMLAQATISGNYAYALYEECTMYVNDGETPEWSIDAFKDIMEIDKESPTYKEFKTLNYRVIKPAVDEINEVTDINIFPCVHKKGKFVDRISFKVERKVQGLLDFNSIDTALDLESKIVEYGVTEKVAERLVKDFDRDRIIGNIEYVKRQIELGKVSDSAAFLVKAITDDYRPKESALTKKIREEDEARRAAIEKKNTQKQEQENKELLKERAKIQAAETYWDNLAEAEKDSLKIQFTVWLSADNKIVFDQFKTKGLSSKPVKSSLFRFINETILVKS